MGAGARSPWHSPLSAAPHAPRPPARPLAGVFECSPERKVVEAAVAVAAEAVEKKKGGDKPVWEVCEIYGAKECADNDDRCSLCATPGGKELCFDIKIADKLPPCERCRRVPAFCLGSRARALPAHAQPTSSRAPFSRAPLPPQPSSPAPASWTP